MSWVVFRAAGVGYIGQPRLQFLRAWLDPDKLAALNLSAMDVVTAIAQQNVQVSAGKSASAPFRRPAVSLTINTLRLH